MSLATDIIEQVLSFIRSPEPERFEELLLRVYRNQYSSVLAYKTFCEHLKRTPRTVETIDDVPLVSTVAFKYADFSPASLLPNAQACEFTTSGTTVGRDRRGRHVVPYSEVYRTSALAHLRTMLFPDRVRTRMLSLHPAADLMPESSLSAMITWCMDEFGAGEHIFAADRLRVDTESATDFLRETEKNGEPVCILGTTAAFAALFDCLADRPAHLSPGSRMMDTGGAKGQAVPLTSKEVVALASRRLGIAPDKVINEYGMTELCSQLYDATEFNSPGVAVPGEDRVKIAPPWMRPAVVDPVTMRRVPDGAVGMLAFYDLANVGSVSAIVTEDIGIVSGNRVRVLGRAASGGARGCALSISAFSAERGA